MTANKKVAITISANTRQLKADMRRATGEVRAFERQVGGVANRMKRMRMNFMQSGIFGRGGGALRTAAGFAGVFGMQQMIMDAKNMDAALTDIAITGNLSAGKLEKLKKQIFDVSNATGKGTNELTAFVATVTTMTGDASGAQSALSGVADVMVATGASGEALAGTYVKLTTTMGLLPKQAREAFNVLRSQEKLGSITMSNIAANFGKVIGAAGVFGAEGKGIKGVRTMGGLYQIAQRGFAVGQEGEAATSAGSFLGFLGRRAKQVKKTFGVEVFDKSGNARDLPTVFEELGKAFNTKREAFRTKGQLIFGRSGIRTAQQLALAANTSGGFGGRVGAFSSANSLLRTAGGTDEIGADFKKRMASKSQSFTVVLNRLKNTLQKFALPVFAKMADSLKEFGPDLVKTLKFILEHSRGLLKLWLGYKGMTFFRNLMAPIQGGAPGSGMPMGLPVAGPMGPMPGQPGFIGPLQPRGSWYQRNRGMLARGAIAGARGGGQLAGMAGLMGYGPDVGPGWANDASNMGLMSGNPYAMAAAGAYKIGQASKQYGITGKVYGEDTNGGWNARRIGMGFATLGGSEAYRRIQGEPEKKFGVSVDNVTRSALKLARGLETAQLEIAAKTNRWRTGTIEGQIHGEKTSSLLTELGMGGGIGGAKGDFLFNRGVLGKQGMPALKSLRSRIQSQMGPEKRIAAQKAMSMFGNASEENMRKASPEYARMAAIMDETNRLMADLRSGKKIEVTAQVVISPDGVATRLGQAGGAVFGAIDNAAHTLARSMK